MLSTKFVKASKEYSTFEKPVNAPYIRKTFDLDFIPDSAEITLTCTGFYRFFINGTEITDGRLAPNITNPDQIIFYDKYDVKNHLRQGRNCIAFILGNSISNAPGGYIWEFDKALFRSAPKLALNFEAGSGDKTFSFEADESFRCAPSPIVFDDLRCGEHYDATLEISGWNEPEFDDSGWCSVISTDPARGKAMLNDTDRVVITEELEPVKVYKGQSDMSDIIECSKARGNNKYSDNAYYKPETKETGYVFEFAKNTACVPKLKIKGRKGQRIIIQASEFCKDGVIDYYNINLFYPVGFCQRDIYICKGEGEEEYIPSFTYHGARYFFVVGLDDNQIENCKVTMLVMNSALEERGNFYCSDDIANKLQQNTRISSLANFIYFPTDCPHREKNGWTGDAAMSAEHFTQNLAVERSLRQWLKMMCAGQRDDGAFPGIIPSSGWGYAWGNGHGPAWDLALVEIPYQTYIYRGDTTMFREVAGSLIKYLHFLTTLVRPDGLEKIGLGDWVHAMRKVNSHNHVCPNVVSDSIICYHICKKSEFMFNVCGMKPQAAFAKSFGDELYGAIRARLIDYDTMTVYGSCQCAQSMGLYYGIFEKGEEKAAYDRLIELVHEADDHIDCGMIGVRTMFRTLAKHGDAELAYKMITRTDAPSYGIWVSDFGLTSMPESWHDTVDGKATSLNHHFLADISGFFISHIAGLTINPYKDNPSEVRIAPSFIEKLDHAEAYYNTVSGKVSVKWERSGDKILLTIDKPEKVTGDIVLPNGYRFVSKNGQLDDYMVGRGIFNLDCGTYTIVKK